MRVVVVALGAALALLAPLPVLAQGGSQGSQGGAPGMGSQSEGLDHLTPAEPRRSPGEAIRRSQFDESVEKMFAATDTDKNGLVTLAELRAVIEARKDAAIRGRFANIDTNRDQQVSFAEFNQWQRGLGSVVLDDEGAAAASNTLVSEDVGPPPIRGEGAPVMAHLVAPLNATMLVAANADHDGGASLAEVAAYEGKRFDAADVNKDGWVTGEELHQTSAPRR